MRLRREIETQVKSIGHGPKTRRAGSLDRAGSTRVALSIAMVLGCVHVLPGCGRNVGTDCDAATTSLQVSLREPVTREQRTEDVAVLARHLAEWDKAAPAVRTPEVRDRASKLAAVLAQRKTILESARFGPAPPAPPPPPRPPTSAKPNSEVLHPDMISYLADRLAPEASGQLAANEKSVEVARSDLIDWCNANR